MKSKKSRYRVSTQWRQFDIRLICNFLEESYWAKDIPRGVVLKSIKNSLSFGVFCGRAQVAFARVITDRATFAYLADVFVVPEHRGRGVARLLVRAILAHRELQGLRRWMLATSDAHGLYEKFGFAPLPNPANFMTIHNPEIYGKSKTTPPRASA
jgi:GNAT superfamily N-acetyltransferase